MMHGGTSSEKIQWDQSDMNLYIIINTDRQIYHDKRANFLLATTNERR